MQSKKNVLLFDNVTEGLTYTYNYDSTGYWLLAHERLNNTFISFEISRNGVGAIMNKSNIGRDWGLTLNDIGNFMSYIKISPNGKRISVSNSYNYPNRYGKVEVYDFNNCNGQVSNEIIINGLPYICYGNAFSSNSNVLYITNLEFPSSLYQVNLMAGSESAINESLSIIYTAPQAPVSQNRINYLAGLQLFEDGKIYVTESAQKFIHCINNPDELGNNCDFTPEKIKLASGSSSRYSLPQLIPAKLNEPKIILDSILISINDSCVERIKTARLVGFDKPDFMEWKLINISKLDTFIRKDSSDFVFSNPSIGDYKLEVIYKQNCKNYYSFKNFRIFDCECEGLIAISDTCNDDEIELSLVSKDYFNNIEWQITDTGGNVLLKQKSKKINILLDSARKINVKAIVNFNCKLDTIYSIFNLSNCPECNLYIQNVFSPNKDGINDNFKISTICDLENFTLSIFNRWGEQIFESTQINKLWDGTYKNKPCQEGIYIFKLSYKIKGKPIMFKNGILTLLQ